MAFVLDALDVLHALNVLVVLCGSSDVACAPKWFAARLCARRPAQATPPKGQRNSTKPCSNGDRIMYVDLVMLCDAHVSIYHHECLQSFIHTTSDTSFVRSKHTENSARS